MRYTVIVGLFGLNLLLFPYTVAAQPAKAPDPTLMPEKPVEEAGKFASYFTFLEDTNIPLLSDRRKQLEREITDLQVEVDSDTRKISVMFRNAGDRRQFYELRKTDVERQLAGAKAVPRPDPLRLKELTDRIEEAKNQIARAADDLKTAQEIEKLLEKKRDTLTRKKTDLYTIEKKIDEAINVQLRILGYRSMVSILFAVLILALMWGFFKVMREDAVVRRAIFGAQSGIQFLTLFCLVIAIFIFGITGILEGKELSALLGGLSGYILGRVTQREPQQTPASTEPKPEAKG